MKRSLKWSLIGASVLAAVAGGAVVWHQRPVTHEYFTDADTIRAPRAAARVRDILWQPPVRLSEIVNTSTEDYEPRISWDGLTLFFVRGKAGENADIYVSQRTPGGWTEPEPLAEINSDYEDLGPEPSADGAALYFYSDRPGGEGGYDLWVSRRTEAGWQPAANLGPLVNTEYNDYGPALAPDGKTLYFASNRPQPRDSKQPSPDAWPATVREDLFHRTYDLFVAPITDRGVGLAQPLAVLNTRYNEGAPCVSTVGDFVYFSSDRPGGQGGFDVYRSRCVRGVYEPAANLGPTLNTPANELDPGLTHLGYAIYFSSDRPAERIRPDKPNDYNLYYTSSREVFLDSERETRSPIDWAALWRQILPNLMWALLALLLLLLLWALAGSVRSGKLSLLARCLLASVMLHMLLMMMLNFWKVTASVVTAFRERGEIRIALAAPARGNDIAAQIRGELTEVAPPDAPRANLRRQPTALTAAQTDATAVLAVDRQRIEFEAQPAAYLSADEAPPHTPETPLSEPRVGLRRTSSSSLSELALPSETEQIDADEWQLVVQMAPAPKTALTRPTMRVATSQPADPSRELAVGHTPTGSDNDSASSESIAAAPAAEDAKPESRARPAPAPRVAALDNLPALEVALPGDSAPEEAVAELPPPVAAATAQSPSRPTASFLTNQRHSERYDRLEPAYARSSTDDVALATAIEITPIEADPRAPSLVSSSQAQPQDSSSRRAGLALPPLEEVPNVKRGEVSPSVVAATSEVARPPVADYAATNGPSPFQQPVALVPGSHADSPSGASSLFDRDLAKRGVEASEPGSSPPLPRLAAGRPDRLALALRLPNETEPPARDRDPGCDRAPIRGRVTDRDTGEPLAGATVRLDLPDTEPLTATTDAAGHYALAVPPVPDNFALSASHEDYVPAAANVPAAALERGTLTQDFELEPSSDSVVAVEIEPEVHHLGNDRWEGRINSQFQKASEGRWFVAGFDLSSDQLPPRFSQAEVTLLAKGVQCPHQVLINDYRLRRRLDSAPRDGSFGEFTAPFDPAILVEGANTIRIRCMSCQGDVDDFEFVNIRIILSR